MNTKEQDLLLEVGMKIKNWRKTSNNNWRGSHDYLEIEFCTSPDKSILNVRGIFKGEKFCQLAMSNKSSEFGKATFFRI